MDIENGEKRAPELDKETLKGAFASINALKFVLELDGSLDPSIDKDRLITSQANLILKDVRDILPDLDGIRVNGIVALRPDCKEDGGNDIFSLEGVEDILFKLGKEQGILGEIGIPGYSSDG